MTVGGFLGPFLLATGAALDSVLPQAAKYRIGSLTARAVFAVWSSGRENVIANMSHVLGKPARHPETQRLARQSMENYGWYLADFLSWLRLTPERLQQRVREFHGEEHIAEALQAGKGVIFVSGHFGLWDLGGAMLAQRFPVLIPADRLQSGTLDWIVRRVRDRLGFDTVPVERGLRAMLRQLQSNRVVGLLFDRPMGTQGVPVTFFGKQVRLPAGPAALALRTGAPLVMCECRRSVGNGLAVTVYPPLYIAPSGDERRDIQAVMQQLASMFEEIVRGCPEQWYMFRRMWPQPLTADSATAEPA